MSFLYPAFLLGALAIAVPVVLHLLRRDVAPEVPFTAVRLLHKSSIERAERRRLRDVLLLLARVAALLLLAAAFARPYLRAATPGPLLLVAIDRSYSMGRPDAFAAALTAAREIIASAGRGDRLAVVAFDDRAELIAPPGGASDARTALDALQPGSGATRYAPVVQQVDQLAAGGPGRLVIIGDQQRSGWDGEATLRLPAGWTVDAVDVSGSRGSQPRENLALTRTTLEPDRVIATIQNLSPASRTGKVHVKLDGREVATATFNVSASATTDAPVSWRAPDAGVLELVIDDAGGVPADNVRFVALAGQQKPKTLIIAGSGAEAAAATAKPAALYLSRALGASDDGVDVVTTAGVASISDEELGRRPGIALLSTKGMERPARERLAAYLQGGGGIFAAASADLEPAMLSEIAGWKPAVTSVDQNGPLTLAPTDLRHPIFRPFGALAANLGQIRFERAWNVAPQGWTVIARFSNGTAALLERPAGRGRVVLFASDVDRRWNDLPLHPAFVPFALESLRYVSGDAAGDRRSGRDFTVAEAPAEAKRTPGVYAGPGKTPYTVNVDTRESAVDRMEAADFARMVQGSAATAATQGDERQARQTESRQSYWQYGLVLMIATLVAESVVGRA